MANNFMRNRQAQNIDACQGWVKGIHGARLVRGDMVACRNEGGYLLATTILCPACRADAKNDGIDVTVIR